MTNQKRGWPEIKPGDKIYVPTALHVYRGIDDVRGGLATVTKVEMNISGGELVPFVEVKEIPNTGYNWELLAQEQEELKQEFGQQVACPDPDFRPEFNDDEADWVDLDEFTSAEEEFDKEFMKSLGISPE